MTSCDSFAYITIIKVLTQELKNIFKGAFDSDSSDYSDYSKTKLFHLIQTKILFSE